jgi:hypothetical protein
MSGDDGCADDLTPWQRWRQLWICATLLSCSEDLLATDRQLWDALCGWIVRRFPDTDDGPTPQRRALRLLMNTQHPYGQEEREMLRDFWLALLARIEPPHR